jgi:nucleoid DNA-binding protein
MWVTRVTGFWHKPGLQMAKTELQIALAAATETNKRTAGVFLDTLSALAYKEIKKNGECVLPGFGKLVKRRGRPARALIQRPNRRSKFQPRPSSNSESPGAQRMRFWG